MQGNDLTTTVVRLARQLAGQPRPLELIGRVQRYAWGGFDYLRELTGLDLPANAPAAEWWIGAHPVAPAVVRAAFGDVPLDQLIAHDPATMLGDEVVARFGPRLPFLLKVLDVREMLSIQAHPSKAQAEGGFARENAAGVPVDAPQRNYRDANHKPEAQVALTPFWMLCGFRHPADLHAIVASRPELDFLSSHVAGRLAAGTQPGSIVRECYERVMRLTADQVGTILERLAERLAPTRVRGALDERSPDLWVLRARDQCRGHGGSCDPGLLSMYLLNLVCLSPGESTFLGAGILHAYLRGAAVGIMASSDNVLRGGLTPKHVDVPALLDVLSFEPASPQVSAGRQTNGHERLYSAPAEEFALARHDLRAGCDRVMLQLSRSPEVLIVIEGEARIEWADGMLPMRRGAAVFLPPRVSGTLRSDSHATVFRAFVPQPNPLRPPLIM